MQIVLTGSHGTGKTALLKSLLDSGVIERVDSHYHHWDHIVFDGVGRHIHTEKKHWSEKGKQRYFNYYYVWNHYVTRNFVGSRAIYDTWAYSRLGIGLDFNRRLFNWAVHHINYDFVFYVPIEFSLVGDGVRYEDAGFQILHDRETKLILDYHHIPYHTVTGSLKERVGQVRAVLNV